MRQLEHPKRIGLLVVLAVTVAYFRSFILYIGVGGIGLTPADYVAAFVVLISLYQILKDGKIRLTRRRTVTIALIVGLVVIHVVRIPPEMQSIREVTLALQLIRDGLLFVSILVLIGYDNIQSINRGIFYISAAIAGVMIFIYVAGTTFEPAVLSVFEPTLYESEGHKPSIRAQWFVRDPNFFGILLLLGLFCGIETNHASDHGVGSLLGLVVILFALVLTLSRSVVGLTVGIGILRVGMWAIRWRAASFDGRAVLSVFAGVAGPIIVGGYALRNLGISITGSFLNRIQNVQIARFGLWNQVLSAVENNFLLGLGPRATERILEGYAHNSYLELFAATGLIGTSVYLAFIAVVTAVGLRPWIRGELEDVRAWWWAWIAILAFQFFFTYVYLPLSWIIAAIVLLVEDRYDTTRPS